MINGIRAFISNRVNTNPRIKGGDISFFKANLDLIKNKYEVWLFISFFILFFTLLFILIFYFVSYFWPNLMYFWQFIAWYSGIAMTIFTAFFIYFLQTRKPLFSCGIGFLKIGTKVDLFLNIFANNSSNGTIRDLDIYFCIDKEFPEWKRGKVSYSNAVIQSIGATYCYNLKTIFNVERIPNIYSQIIGLHSPLKLTFSIPEDNFSPSPNDNKIAIVCSNFSRKNADFTVTNLLND